MTGGGDETDADADGRATAGNDADADGRATAGHDAEADVADRDDTDRQVAGGHGA
ncbi:MAG: hypothetical protein HYY06_32260 [Deltaproteobacteria bacterium]|nr:hypothetical protein [Deltaproteobacteria bacterium]